MRPMKGLIESPRPRLEVITFIVTHSFEVLMVSSPVLPFDKVLTLPSAAAVGALLTSVPRPVVASGRARTWRWLRLMPRLSRDILDRLSRNESSSAVVETTGIGVAGLDG